MSDADQLRLRGNALYKEGRFEDARACYSEVIALLEDGGSSDSQLAVTVAQLYSNRAQTSIQERNFAQALQDAARALEFDPENEKAQLRRLISLENLERFETAFHLVERLLDSPETRKQRPSLFEYAVAARRRLRKNLQQDKAAAQQERHAIGRMVHENQKLRINFGCLIPAHVVLGQFFDVAVNIGNEFGLFRRDYLETGDRIKLQCNLRKNDDNAFKLVFREARASVTASSMDALHAPVVGVITLNDRGKTLFEMAIVAADGSHHHERPSMALSLSVHPESAAKWNLLPIVSLPFTLSSTATEITASEHDTIVSALGIHCCRPVWLPELGRELLLAESPGNLGIGGKLWDSCLVLTRYLSRHRELLKGKSVIELGSGLGLVGMYCSLLEAHCVTLTDIDEVVPLLDYNIRLNFPASSRNVEAVAHFWGTSVDNLPPSPDVVVLSDVVYDPEGYVPLVTSLGALALEPETTIFMAHRSRNPMEHQFFELLGQTFNYELVDWASEDRQEEAPQAGSTPATTSKDERVLQDVKIFRISRRSSS